MKWLLFIGYIVFFNKIHNILGCTKPSFANLTVQSDFNLTEFLGIWYEIQWLPDAPHNASDIWRNYYISIELANSSTENLLLYGKARVLNNNTCFSIDPWSIIANNSAKMILKNQDPNNPTLLNWPYYILQTDYNNYALVYACASPNYTYTDPCMDPGLWLFSRTTSLSTDYLSGFYNYIENVLCINQTELEITPQDGISCYSSSNIRFIDLILFVFLFFLYI